LNNEFGNDHGKMGRCQSFEPMELTDHKCAKTILHILKHILIYYMHLYAKLTRPYCTQIDDFVGHKACGLSFCLPQRCIGCRGNISKIKDDGPKSHHLVIFMRNPESA
jgi:hypothetical protein